METDQLFYMPTGIVRKFTSWRIKMKKSSTLILGVCLAIGLAIAFTGCASAPKTPDLLIYNPNSVPEDQLATLYVPPGNFEIFSFNGEILKRKWYQPSTLSPGLNVRFPTGSVVNQSEIKFNYWDNTYGNAQNINIRFSTAPGRNYKFYKVMIGPGKMAFLIFETSETREPNSDEQILVIKRGKDLALNVLAVIDKDTSDPRSFSLGRESELRIIVKKGEHTVDFEELTSKIMDKSAAIKQNGEQPHNISVSSTPIMYSFVITNWEQGYILKQE